MMFILEHNTNILGSLKSTRGKDFGNFQKALQASFEDI